MQSFLFSILLFLQLFIHLPHLAPPRNYLRNPNDCIDEHKHYAENNATYRRMYFRVRFTIIILLFRDRDT